jgi:CRP-like cAMP-binding protein
MQKRNPVRSVIVVVNNQPCPDKKTRGTKMASPSEVHLVPSLTLCPNAKPATHCEQCRVRSLSLCGALEPDELHELDRLSRPLTLSARETIFEQDELADAVFNITSGSARLYRLLPDGRRQIVGFALYQATFWACR